MLTIHVRRHEVAYSTEMHHKRLAQKEFLDAENGPDKSEYKPKCELHLAVMRVERTKICTLMAVNFAGCTLLTIRSCASLNAPLAAFKKMGSLKVHLHAYGCPIEEVFPTYK